MFFNTVYYTTTLIIMQQKIEKSVKELETQTKIWRLDEEKSVEELARMLGGESITETVLSNAREMKEMAQQQKNTRVK